MTVWICAGLAIGVAGVIQIIMETKNSYCFVPCGVIIVAFIAITTRHLVGKILDLVRSFLLENKKDAAVRLKHYYELKKIERTNLIKRARDDASSAKQALEKRFESNTTEYRASQFYLKRDEGRISARHAFVVGSTHRLTEIAEMLDKEIKAFPSDLPADDLKMQRERTSSRLKELTLQDLKYSAKLEEIELLRLWNAMQAEIPKPPITSQIRDQTKQKIDAMAKLSEVIYGKLQKAELGDSGSERLWIERIKLVRDALRNSHKGITVQIADLAHGGQDHRPTDFSLEVNLGLEKVSTLLTIADFEKDYRLLQARYEK